MFGGRFGVTWELIGFCLRIKDPDRITGLETNRIA